MRPYIVGIGGAGGNILMQFLQSQDAYLPKYSFGEYLAFGNVKGVWLDSASHEVQDNPFYGSLASDSYPCYLICHGGIEDRSKTRDYVTNKYGYDLKASGYDRRAEYLKGIFEVFEIDENLQSIASEEFKGKQNPLAGYIWREGIRPFTTLSIKPDEANKNGQQKLCDSILFIASLGGGTGTGFINPITSSVRAEELKFPIFALGILTEKGTDRKNTEEGQRDLGAVIAMYDLLTKEAGKGIDGLIVMDNQILIDKFGDNFAAIDSSIHMFMKPFIDVRDYPGAEQQDEVLGIQRVFLGTTDDKSNLSNGDRQLFPPILIPCYYSKKGSTEEVLVNNALSKVGRLFNCDPTKAERALVFARGFLSSSKIVDAVSEYTGISSGEIIVYRKIGIGNSNDILILLRNPYGGNIEGYNIDGTFEYRIYNIINEAIKYIGRNENNILGLHGYTEITKKALKNYFYGTNGLKNKLEASQRRLRNGQKPFFVEPIRIFGEHGAVIEDEMIGLKGQGHTIGQAQIEEIIRKELERMLSSEEGKAKIRTILNS